MTEWVDRVQRATAIVSQIISWGPVRGALWQWTDSLHAWRPGHETKLPRAGGRWPQGHRLLETGHPSEEPWAGWLGVLTPRLPHAQGLLPALVWAQRPSLALNPPTQSAHSRHLAALPQKKQAKSQATACSGGWWGKSGHGDLPTQSTERRPLLPSGWAQGHLLRLHTGSKDRPAGEI